MNVENLKQNAYKLIADMRQVGYSKGYIYNTERMIRYVLTFEQNEHINSYADVLLAFEQEKHGKYALGNARTALGIIERYDCKGISPNYTRKGQTRTCSSYFRLCRCFRSFVDDYRCEAGKGEKKLTTIQGEARNISSFLAFMQKKGAHDFEAINQTMVIDYFVDEFGYPNKSYSLQKQIKAVFRTCATLYPTESKKIIAYIPKLKKRRKNIQYLTTDELLKINAVLVDESATLTLRDRAMGVMILETGLRSCDIANLTLDSIDWGNDIIKIKQQKTQYPLELPLSAIAGNAIYDYILSERPCSTAQEVFVKSVPPFDKIESRSLVGVAAKIMAAAGIRQNPGDKKGFHVFRHHLATSLLENNIPSAVISRTLGHTSPASVEPYLSADFRHLKECALSIEDFPMMPGVMQ